MSWNNKFFQKKLNTWCLRVDRGNFTLLEDVTDEDVYLVPIVLEEIVDLFEILSESVDKYFKLREL